MGSSSKLIKGTLRARLLDTTEAALRSGALQPIPTDYEFVEDSNVRFLVRVLANLSRKDEDRKRRNSIREATGREVNPFLPYEEELFVSDISDTHLALLNKFNVVEHHLLVVTRRFEDQDVLLTLKDFEAMWISMLEYPSLAFYNGGRVAGASQRHKHLQLVPLPLSNSGPSVPLEPLLVEATGIGQVTRLPGLPFRNAFVRPGFPAETPLSERAEVSHELFQELLSFSGMGPGVGPDNLQSRPYNLLATTEWMLLVPRSGEFFEGVSVNSLGFAGALLVRNEADMARLKEVGPMTVLKEVSFP